ncbi:MAG TPA: ribbon-helix-helix protein, CopG family [Solirubrobacterales bacterium]
MRSLRLDPSLDERVRRAAALEDTSVSEFLRKAAAERVERTLSGDNSERLSYAIGAVRSELGLARKTGEAFADLVETKHRRRR